MKIYMVNNFNELKKNFSREHANITSTKDMLDILEFYKNNNNQLSEQVKHFHGTLNGLVNIFQHLVSTSKSVSLKPLKPEYTKPHR